MKKEYSRFADSTVFEGIVSLRALISVMENCDLKNDRKIQTVLYDENRLKSEKKEFAWLSHRSEELGFKIELVSREDIEDLSVGNTHGGIIAKAGERSYLQLEGNICDNGFYVILDGIEDPYNFGYALRSLYASGVDGVILGKRNWMSAAGVVCRASAGASELMNLYLCEDMADAVSYMKKSGYKVVCADIENSVSIYDCDLTAPVLCVVGGEKRGISKSVMSQADSIIRIDYGRTFGASLSAASAATVLGFEVLRQKIKK